MAAARASTDPRDRLVVELLARTGMRAGELADLEADAVVQIGGNHWLRIPLGKLRNDRYVPLHPQLVDLLGQWTAVNVEHVRAHRRLVADHRGPLNRHTIGRIIQRVGRAAGVDGVHPHRLRHTLATQAINRGMRLEAIAARLGHKKMEMTLIYARIANRVVADEYAAVSAKIDALYGQQPQLPADYETTGMARLRRETHPHARQRPLHPPGRTRLPHGIGLRNLRLLPHQRAVPTHPHPATRPRPRTRTDPTSGAVRRPYPTRRDHRG